MLKSANALLIALLLVATSGRAEADTVVEFGGFAGLHLFNDDNELGIYDGSGAAALGNGIVLGARAAVAVWEGLHIEGELALSPTEPRSGDEVGVTTMGLRLQALYHFSDGKVRPFVLAGAGSSSSFSDNDTLFRNDTDFVSHGGAGVKFGFSEGWGVRFDLRALLPPSTENDFVTVDGEILLGFYKETSSDQVILIDGDGDGLRDKNDSCPNEPEDMDGYEDEDGCPEDQDSDGDGIADSVDQCKDQAEDMDSFEDDDGCPEADNDKDQVLDPSDACPLKAEDKDGFEDEDGCPEADNDKDGIPDTEDKCPLEPESRNGFEDEDGCPDELPKEVQKFSGTIEGIRFQLGSAKIRAVSNRTLNAAVKVFTDFPDLRFEIQGHTDSSGSAERNRELSQARADAVKAYMVDKGIESERIRAKGYGPDLPVGDNTSKEGRALNRRVEFKLLSKWTEIDSATEADGEAAANDNDKKEE